MSMLVCCNSSCGLSLYIAKWIYWKGLYLLNQELQHLAQGNNSKVLVFSAVKLQHNNSVEKVNDIHCLLNHHLDLWNDGNFDALLSTMTAYFVTPTTHPVLQKNILQKYLQS